MKARATRLVILAFGMMACAAEPAPLPAQPPVSAARTYNQKVERRIAEMLEPVHADKKLTIWTDQMALLLLYKNENVEEANRLILEFCGADRMTTYAGQPTPKNRCEALLRIYLMERTRKLLTPEARQAIAGYAWDLLNKYNRDVTRADADKRFFPDWTRSENHFVNDRRRYYLALQIVRMSERYGPDAKLAGETIDSHCRAWDAFWIHCFRDRANEGTDNEIAQPGSYGACTIGVYYDLYDLAGDAEVRELAGKFLTLYWAEVAAEFEPRTGQRAGWSVLRNTGFNGQSPYWARPLLYGYQWHDQPPTQDTLRFDAVYMASFLTSHYRTPEILAAIAHDPNRGSYMSTSRRAMMKPDDKTKVKDTIIFDPHGDSHFRRDVFYTPDYAISTMTVDPSRAYGGLLEQTMGVTFAAGQKDRISAMGAGEYGDRAINGITGNGVAVVARDPQAAFGHDRFQSYTTCFFITKGTLWGNKIEDPSGWLFTRSGKAYAAIRPAAGGYNITNKRRAFGKDRKMAEVTETGGQFLELKEMWAPVVIQMGRAADYQSFEAFCAAVKANRFEYTGGKLTYVSAAGDQYEYWAKGAQPPRINGTAVNLNPPKTFDSPFLSMVHGSSKAVITYPGHKDLVLDFNPPHPH